MISLHLSINTFFKRERDRDRDPYILFLWFYEDKRWCNIARKRKKKYYSLAYVFPLRLKPSVSRGFLKNTKNLWLLELKICFNRAILCFAQNASTAECSDLAKHPAGREEAEKTLNVFLWLLVSLWGGKKPQPSSTVSNDIIYIIFRRQKCGVGKNRNNHLVQRSPIFRLWPSAGLQPTWNRATEVMSEHTCAHMKLHLWKWHTRAKPSPLPHPPVRQVRKAGDCWSNPTLYRGQENYRWQFVVQPLLQSTREPHHFNRERV